MAATTDSFRSSLHGFNRMDVVQFIQKTTSEHELELRRLAEERTRQQEELEQLKAVPQVLGVIYYEKEDD